MAWFKKNNDSNTFKLEGLVSMNVPAEKDSGEPLLLSASISKNVIADNSGPNYVNGNPFKLSAAVNDYVGSDSSKGDEDGWAIDIAQSHHFTIEIKDVSGHQSASGNLLNYRTPNNVYSHFLPVKSMSLTYSSYENMSIPVSIFGDFPLLQRRRVETINLICYDEDTHELEHNLHLWSNECFPLGKYVAYMDDIVKELIYRGYTVDGRESLYIRRFVIPTGQIYVSRDYSENEAKMISFSLACVGDGSTCATGKPSAVTKVNVGSYDAPETESGEDKSSNKNDGTDNSTTVKKVEPLQRRPYDDDSLTYRKGGEESKIIRQYDDNSLTYTRFPSSPVSNGGGSLTYDKGMP